MREVVNVLSGLWFACKTQVVLPGWVIAEKCPRRCECGHELFVEWIKDSSIKSALKSKDEESPVEQPPHAESK